MPVGGRSPPPGPGGDRLCKVVAIKDIIADSVFILVEDFPPGPPPPPSVPPPTMLGGVTPSDIHTDRRAEMRGVCVAGSLVDENWKSKDIDVFSSDSASDYISFSHGVDGRYLLLPSSYFGYLNPG